MNRDVRWLLIWAILMLGNLTLAGLALAEGHTLSALVAAAIAVLSVARWHHWRTVVADRHHAEREGGQR